MPSFLSVIQTLAKANKVFTIVNTAFDASMLGIQIAEAVDPQSVCLAWNVKSLSSDAYEKGKKYDALLDQLSQISTDMENVRQAITNLQGVAIDLGEKWKEVTEISSKLREDNQKLSLQVPSAHKWLIDLQKLKGDSETQLKNLAKTLQVSPGDVAISGTLFGVSVIALVGGTMYERYRARTQPVNRFQLLFDSRDPKWRLMQGAKATVESLFNVGSFAMNIFLVVKLVQQCEAQANTLKDMINTYDRSTPTLNSLVNGCNNDQTKIDTVTTYLEKLGNLKSGSMSDEDSQKLINDGLSATLGNYNTNVDGWLTELDELYKIIQALISAAVAQNSPGINPTLATKLTSGYTDFKTQEKLLKDTNNTSLERLENSREIVKIMGNSLTSTTNNIVKEYQIALIDTKTQQFLVNKAQQIAKKPARLDEFNQNKEVYVRDEGFLTDLNNVYPERTLFKGTDENEVIRQIANYLDLAIKDILNPNTPVNVDLLLGSYECHLYDQGGKNDWHYVTISKVNNTTITWANRAGVSWTLTMTPDKTKLNVGNDCPYFKDHGHKQVTVVWAGDKVSGLRGPFDELYDKSA